MKASARMTSGKTGQSKGPAGGKLESAKITRPPSNDRTEPVKMPGKGKSTVKVGSLALNTPKSTTQKGGRGGNAGRRVDGGKSTTGGGDKGSGRKVA
jgi:hypothetical protein